MARLDAHWLFAVVDEGLVAVGPEREVEIAFDAPLERRREVHGLIGAPDPDPARIARAARVGLAEAAALIDRLGFAGALADRPEAAPELPGTGLHEAILALGEGKDPARLVWTAEELLVLPERADAALARRAVRAFVGGLASDLRLRAYCYLATWLLPTVSGDVPAAERVAPAVARAAELDRASVHVVELSTAAAESVAAERLGSLGAHARSRLGTVIRLEEEALPDGRRHGLAIYPVANLRYPTRLAQRYGRGVATDGEQARLIARAEAAERYAAGDVAPHELVRAREEKLSEPAITPRMLFALSPRQSAALEGFDAYDASDEHLWVAARAADDSIRWALAQAVFIPFADPRRPRQLPLFTTSSGLAAHTTLDEAVERAFCELIERDAFSWHWVQRISRERIERRSLPGALREHVNALEGQGFELDLVNLTLDTRPVVLCVMRGGGWLIPAASADADPLRAAEKVLREVSAFSSRVTGGAVSLRDSPVSPEAVRGPLDHLQLHHDAELLDHDRFLFSSPETIAIDEVGGASGPIMETVGEIAEPLTVDLSSPASAPFSVVRALAPGMIPISFGYDREPLGMARLAAPKVVFDGRRIGRDLDVEAIGPLVPHPFP